MTTTPFTELDLRINVSVIHDYFIQINQSDFIATANLFSEQGGLKPPFEKMITGRNAIVQYLEKEALGIKIFPTHMRTAMSGQSYTQYQVKGKVKTNYFTVNASWLINLNTEKEITLVEIKLLENLSNLLESFLSTRLYKKLSFSSYKLDL